MVGFLIAMISGASMAVQGVFNTKVTRTTGMWVSNGWVQLSSFSVCLMRLASSFCVFFSSLRVCLLIMVVSPFVGCGVAEFPNFLVF